MKILKRSAYLFLHLAVWFGYLFLLMILAFVAGQAEDINIEEHFGYYFTFGFGAAILPPVLAFYSYSEILLPRFLKKRKKGTSFAVGAGLSIASVLVGFLFIFLFNEDAWNCVSTGLQSSFPFTFILATVFGIIGLVIKGFFEWYEGLKVKEELVKKNHQMELALVKSQLDPHFLFNTLNNIDTLMIDHSDEASIYLNKLSDILRFILYEAKGDKILLADEIAYIKKYMELQKIRTSNQSYVDLKINGSVNGQKIAPMIFIPFIENAFKHSPNKKVENAVQVAINISADKILFECENKLNHTNLKSNELGGLGNDLIARRLELLYPGNHSLSTVQNEDSYKVTLTVANG